MIPKEALIALFERMYKEHWSYEPGAAREGCVDCSGAFVYAYKALGGGAIEHGSNAIARKRVGQMLSLGERARLPEAEDSAISQVKPGYAAFKRRPYDAALCAAKYDDGQGDVYHIGLVDATGRYVLNAKSTRDGFSRDALDKWDAVAPLKAVDYAEKGEKTMEALFEAVVTTQRDPLRIRDMPETGAVIGYAPKGAVVQVLELGEWARIRYGGMEGYASWAYLTRLDGAGERLPDEAGADSTTLEREDGKCITLAGSWRVAED